MDTMSLLLKKELFLQDESDQLWGHKARNIGHGVRDTEHYPWNVDQSISAFLTDIFADFFLKKCFF